MENDASVQLGGILIVTATLVETRAVLDVFSQGATPPILEIGNQFCYPLGYQKEIATYLVQSQPGSATPGGSLVTVLEAIRLLQPQAVFMCGIAFGLRRDKQKLGDILVAKQMAFYEPQKIDSRKGAMPRGDRVMVSERLLSLCSAVVVGKKLEGVHFGTILSGEKLVNDSEFLASLQNQEREAMGGEMEGAGLYAAAHYTKTDWILVKAICDWGDGNKDDASQSQAAEKAAAFVFKVVHQGGWKKPQDNVSTLVDRSDCFAEAAQILQSHNNFRAGACALWIQANLAQLPEQQDNALHLLEQARQEALKHASIQLACWCSMDLARLQQSQDSYLAEAYARTVLRSVKLSPESAQALRYFAKALWNQGHRRRAILACRRGAEEYELLAEEMLLSVDTEGAFWHSLSAYLQDREAWRMIAIGTQGANNTKLLSDQNTMPPLPDAQRRCQEAQEIYSKNRDFAGRISDSDHKLNDIEKLYFQAKQYRFLVARMYSEPQEFELRAAKQYYVSAMRTWSQMLGFINKMVDWLDRTGTSEQKDRDWLGDLVAHADRRRAHIRKLLAELEQDLTQLDDDESYPANHGWSMQEAEQ